MYNYQIIKELGTGSAGRVFLAKDKTATQHYAIKEISTESSDLLKSTLLEIENMKKLTHPFIVRYHSSFSTKTHSSNDSSKLYIVMEYVDNGDLATFISNRKKRNKYLSEDEVLRIFVQIVIALQYIHSQNVVHRDLKPQNIFLTKLGLVKIGDFGVSKQLNKTSSLCQTKVGTPYYLSPEIWNNEPYGNKSDIWSLGCILHELCTLNKAFQATNINQLIVAVFTPGSVKPIGNRYSLELQNLVTMMLSQDPKMRPAADDILNIPFIQDRIRQLADDNEKKLRTNRRIPTSPSYPSVSSSPSIMKTISCENPFQQISQLPRLRPIFSSPSSSNEQMAPAPKKKKKVVKKKKKTTIPLITSTTELPLPHKTLPAWAIRAKNKVQSEDQSKRFRTSAPIEIVMNAENDDEDASEDNEDRNTSNITDEYEYDGRSNEQLNGLVTIDYGESDEIFQQNDNEDQNQIDENAVVDEEEIENEETFEQAENEIDWEELRQSTNVLFSLTMKKDGEDEKVVDLQRTI